MADREEIVEIFSELINFADNDVHPVVSPENWHVYSKLRDLIDQAEEDALALLKKQEPRVMSLEEAIEVVSKDGGIVWIEQKCHPLDTAHVLPTNHICDSPQRKFQDYGKEFVPKRYSYRYMWRCWTSWPTDEQRKAVPWE